MGPDFGVGAGSEEFSDPNRDRIGTSSVASLCAMLTHCADAIRLTVVNTGQAGNEEQLRSEVGTLARLLFDNRGTIHQLMAFPPSSTDREHLRDSVREGLEVYLDFLSQREGGPNRSVGFPAELLISQVLQVDPQYEGVLLGRFEESLDPCFRREILMGILRKGQERARVVAGDALDYVVSADVRRDISTEGLISSLFVADAILANRLRRYLYPSGQPSLVGVSDHMIQMAIEQLAASDGAQAIQHVVQALVNPGQNRGPFASLPEGDGEMEPAFRALLGLLAADKLSGSVIASLVKNERIAELLLPQIRTEPLSFNRSSAKRSNFFLRLAFACASPDDREPGSSSYQASFGLLRRSLEKGVDSFPEVALVDALVVADSKADEAKKGLRVWRDLIVTGLGVEDAVPMACRAVGFAIKRHGEVAAGDVQGMLYRTLAECAVSAMALQPDTFRHNLPGGSNERVMNFVREALNREVDSGNRHPLVQYARFRCGSFGM